MKSSISSFARFSSSRLQVGEQSPSNTARASIVSSSSAPRSCRRAFIALRDAVLQPQLRARAPATRPRAAGVGPFAVEPAATES